MRYMTIALGLGLAVAFAAPGRAGNKDFSEQIKAPVRQAIDTRQTTQQAEQQYRDARRNRIGVYEQLQQARKQLEDRKEHLQHEIAATRDRITLKQKQLEDIEQIATQVSPFLQELTGRLRQLVSGDLPFLTDERRQRITRLAELMENPEVSISEKFRKIMEALLVEAEYGNTIEVYQQTIELNNAPSLVNIFRLGRISLFYQTLDRKRCGFYDVAAGDWRPLAAAFNRSIQTAIEIGAKRRPVELLTLPLGRMASR